jgi:hypothetical protein
MEIRTRSRTGPVVVPPAELTAALSHQIEDMKQPLLDRLNRDPAGFAQVEVEIHDRSRRPADQMTASLLAEATIAADRAEGVKRLRRAQGSVTFTKNGSIEGLTTVAPSTPSSVFDPESKFRL